MFFPICRAMRTRQNENFRRMVRETQLSVDDIVMPFFVVEGKKVKNPIGSMPGNFQMSVDHLVKEVEETRELGITSVLLFGIPGKKDEEASGAYAENCVFQHAIRAIKDRIPEILVVADVCLCEYTSHGHCGTIKDGSAPGPREIELDIEEGGRRYNLLRQGNSGKAKETRTINQRWNTNYEHT